MGQDDPPLGLTRTWAETDEISVGGPSVAEGGLARGAALGRYVVLECLGAGAMGIVFAAYDPELDRRVAVKVLHMRSSADATAGRARLLREAQAMARLSHPNVVAVHDVGTFEGELPELDGSGGRTRTRVFVAMEFVDGVTLTHWSAERERSWTEVLEVLQPVARALEAVHATGVVHRDVKPDNIMVGRDGRVRLMDLGLARPFELARDGGDGSSRRSGEIVITAPEGGVSRPRRSPDPAIVATVTRFGALAGTPAYMAPEQYLRGTADAKTDQFSFCVTLYESLWRKRPFEGTTMMELAHRIVDGVLVAPPRDTDVPRWLQAVVLRGLQSDPDRRFGGMDALVAELTRVRRRTGLRAGTVVSALVVGGLGWQWWATTRDDRCEDAGAEIGEIWNAERRAALDDAFAGTDAAFAHDTAKRAADALDEYADAWAAMRIETCRAASLRGGDGAPEPALRNACLDERRAELAALVDVLAAADRSAVERAVSATSSLSALGQCADPSYLAARQRPWSDRELGAQLADLREQLSRARAFERAGRYDEGTELARAVVDEAERLAERPLLAEAEYRLGELQNSSGKYAEAEATLMESFVDARWSRHELIAIDAANLLAYVIGVNEGRYDDGLLWGRIAEAELGPTAEQSDARASLFNNLGNIHAGKAEYQLAAEELDRAIAIATALYGPDHLMSAKYQANLVPVLSYLGRAADAVALGREVLRVYADNLGPDHPYVGVVQNNLCSAMFSNGDVDGATACFVENLAQKQRSLGPEHPQVAFTLNNLGALLHVAGRDDEAWAYLERAKALFERSFPADHPNFAALEVNFGECAHAMGRYDEAVLHHGRALELRRKIHGDDHGTVGASRSDLADALLASGRPREALAEIERALAILAEHPADDRTLARIRARRGLVLAALDRGAEAERELMAAIAALGPDAAPDDVLGRSLFALAQLQWDGGRREQSHENARRALAVFRADGGVSRSGVVDTAAEIEVWLRAHPEP